MRVEENFLEQEYFDKLQSLVLGNNFPWFYNDHVIRENDAYFQLVHILFKKNAENSSQYKLFLPVLSVLNVEAVCRVKLNLLTKKNEIVEHGLHIDVPDCTTAILYINTNNGYTKFESGEIITSEANKLEEFDSNLKHTGTSCTDEKRRVTLNLNYYARS